MMQKSFTKKKKGSGKPNFTKKDDFKNVEVKEKANDPSWYTVAGQLAKDVASFSFNNPLGKTVVLRNSHDSAVTAKMSVNTPGIMTIYTLPACGISIDGTSAINLAARNFYTFIRHANSGHSNYDSPDLMLYLLAMDSAYSVYSWMTRIYGAARVYAQTNRYYGDAMLNAMGMDANEVRSNLANLRAFINQFALKLGSFCVPKQMSFYSRHVWMYANIFKDEDVDKSQAYMYVPAAVWKYNEVNGAGRLDTMGVASDISTTYGIVPRLNMTYQDIINIATEVLTPIVLSEDLNIMSGDILKAYGDDGVWKIAQIPEDYAVRPFYSEEVLYQIHNTNFCGSRVSGYATSGVTWNSLSTLRVTQDTTIANGGNLYFSPSFLRVPRVALEKVLDIPKEVPTPEDVLVATRNMLMGDDNVPSGGTDHLNYITSCGSEICAFAGVWYFNDSGVNNCMTMSMTNVEDNLQKMSFWSKFNQAPLLYQYSESYVAQQLFGELANFTVLNEKDINKLHETALLSMFAVPKMGVHTK